MLELVNQYKEAAQLIEAAQAEQELIKAQIKGELAARGTDTFWTVKLSRPLHRLCLSSIPRRSPYSA